MKWDVEIANSMKKEIINDMNRASSCFSFFITLFFWLTFRADVHVCNKSYGWILLRKNKTKNLIKFAIIISITNIKFKNNFE